MRVPQKAAHFHSFRFNLLPLSFAMSSQIATKFGAIKQKLKFSCTICKTLAISVLILSSVIFIFFLNDHRSCQASQFFAPFRYTLSSPKPYSTSSPTDITHLVFGLVGSEKAWRHRKSYIEAWWRPNITRGYLYLDRAPSEDLLPWPTSSPPFRQKSKHVVPVVVHILHALLELVREENGGMRWYVMGDDDSVFFVDNIVRVLAKYDHSKYVYIGGHSESVLPNFVHSFDMGFGGAGFALSYPLAAALAKDLENCLERYWYLSVSDQILMSCVADLGVSLTAEKGLHQIDLRSDISGFLSAHPRSPLMSLHHLDFVDPIFPSMNRFESTNHLMKAANIDQSRLLQQTICYQKDTNWSFSIAWGYSAHIYEKLFPRTFLKKPIQTFRPWRKNPRPPQFLFDTRWPSSDPCEAPHLFLFESIEKTRGDRIVTSYVRSSPRGLPACSFTGNHSADYISKIQVFSSTMKPIEDGRSECCDIVGVNGMNITEVKFRACMKDEIIA